MTLSTISMPQAMAYALLASLPAESGLYATAFSAIPHLLFGVSPYMSLGPFAVVSLMTGNALISTCQSLEKDEWGENSPLQADEPWSVFPRLIPLSSFLTFCVGIVLFLIVILRMGQYINRFLPDALIRGFTAAAAIAIVSSQLKGLLGVSIGPVTGTYLIGKTLYRIFIVISKTNWISLVIGFVTILFIFSMEKLESKVNTDRFISFLAGRPESPTPPATDFKMNVPKVLMAILFMSMGSYYFDFNGNYQVAIIGTVSTGVPVLQTPWKVFDMINPDQKVGLFFTLLPHILTICLVTYCTLKSILQAFPAPMESSLTPRNNNIELMPSPIEPMEGVDVVVEDHDALNINHNEIGNVAEKETVWSEEFNELLSLSMANFLCAIGSGFVSSGSLSRSAILATQTQASSPIANFVSAALVWLAALYLSGGIYYIPMACLSAIVIYALKSTLMKISEGYKLFVKARKVSSSAEWTEFILWILTFLCVLIWDPSSGILVGIGVNLLIQGALYVKKRFIVVNEFQ
jgi:MFS superfamily sulfate permease-like transporter